ncbi:ABC transporter substrate-binding protein [Lysinibacter cavernae]|uniref:Peptide/nickel transport system substrate-binding protein n=1 Tax=Lysinibacter cavernae TaxID=1640652 RepID=A0A7X5R3C9_9MICO|nr:ABC transporter substrate-binding protein [Lysinibacter cavernae]NIH54871.1 peptide/nickel transport system substrate-binding protein [Lysinibacter cavernae]
MNAIKKRSTPWWVTSVSVIASVGLLTSCASGGDAEGKTDVVFAVKDDPVCLDPQQVTITTALNIGRQVVDSLLDQDAETGELVPWLAETWKTNDDLTSFTFTLRDDVTFSDDTKLTADVVKANFDALNALGADASLASQYLAGYESTEVVDDSTVTVNFSQPNAQFLQGSSTITLGLVGEATTKLSAEDRCQTVVGSGPFTVDSYVPNDSAVLAKREGYDWASKLRNHTGEALVETITFAITPENSVRTGGLQSGEFDIIQDLPAADEERFGTDDYTIYARANPGVPTSLIPNTERPIVADEAVRKAILQGTDRTEINDLTGSSLVEPASSALSSATPGYVSQADKMKYNEDAAAKTLEDAGWTLGSDGIREKDGQKLSVSVTAFYGQDVLEAAQIQLKKIGVDLKLNIVTAGDFFGVVASKDYDFLSASLTRTDPDVLRVLFSPESSAAWGIVDDAALESMLQEQARTADETARNAIIADIQSSLIEHAYLVPLLEVAQVHASTANVKGLEFDSSSRLVMYDVAVDAK